MAAGKAHSALASKMRRGAGLFLSATAQKSLEANSGFQDRTVIYFRWINGR